MKNIPLFTTEFGIASLTLEEIAYKQEAYITVHDSLNVKKLIEECADFCRAVGASDIYITGPLIPEDYPLFSRVVRMVCDKKVDWVTDSSLVPVTVNNIDQWRNIYNEKMRNVPCSSTLTIHGAQKLVSEGTAYFVYRDSAIIGIGKVTDNRIDAIAGCIPGMGKEVLIALSSHIYDSQVYVDVSKQNTPAIRLYESLGFRETEVLLNWYHYKK